jgi:hypothetical protein
MTESMQKVADFMQNFRAPRPRIGAAPPPWSRKTAENRRPSAGFWGYLAEISADFARFQGVVLAGFWPVEPKSVSIAGWQADELTEQ